MKLQVFYRDFVWILMLVIHGIDCYSEYCTCDEAWERATRQNPKGYCRHLVSFGGDAGRRGAAAEVRSGGQIAAYRAAEKVRFVSVYYLGS